MFCNYDFRSFLINFLTESRCFVKCGGHFLESRRFHDDESIFAGAHDDKLFALYELERGASLRRDHHLPFFTERGYPQKFLVDCFFHMK